MEAFKSTENKTTFDHNYLGKKRMPIVGEHIKPHTDSVLVIKGLADGPNIPASFLALATMIFKNQAALDSALAIAGPALADILNFESGQLKILIRQVLG